LIGWADCNSLSIWICWDRLVTWLRDSTHIQFFLLHLDFLRLSSEP
jgi:hypothetical protein